MWAGHCARPTREARPGLDAFFSVSPREARSADDGYLWVAGLLVPPRAPHRLRAPGGRPPPWRGAATHSSTWPTGTCDGLKHSQLPSRLVTWILSGGHDPVGGASARSSIWRTGLHGPGWFARRLAGRRRRGRSSAAAILGAFAPGVAEAGGTGPWTASNLDERGRAPDVARGRHWTSCCTRAGPLMGPQRRPR